MKSKWAAYCFMLVFGLVSFALGGLGADLPVQVTRQGYQVEVLIGGKPFTTYYFDPAIAKAYLQPLRSAQGTIVTRGFPIGETIPEDHWHDRGLEPHQRPLYFSHGDIDGLDFWGEEAFHKFYHGQPKQASGRMVLRKVDEMSGGQDSGTVRAEFDLVDPSKRPIAGETQTFTFSGDDQSRIIDCEFVITADHGPVDFGDTKEGAFAIRVAPELNVPPGHMVNSAGAEGEKAIWGKRADWVDYYGTVSGEPVSVAVRNILGRINGGNSLIQDMRGQTIILREMYRKLWLTENLPYYLGNILSRYDEELGRWEEASNRISRNKSIYDQHTLPPLIDPAVPAVR